jgi:hypothetical protein
VHDREDAGAAVIIRGGGDRIIEQPADAAAEARRRAGWPLRGGRIRLDGSRPEIARASVLLPAPLPPTRATMLRAGTVNDTPCRTVLVP